MKGSIPPTGPLDYVGQVSVPFIQKAFNPEPTFNQFPVPSIWINHESSAAFILVSKALGNADWIAIGGAAGDVDTLTGNDSVVVVPSVANINVVGDENSGITFTGSDDTLTATLANIPNASLSNSSITLIEGSGIDISTSGVFLGGSTTITNTGVVTLSDDANTSIDPLTGNIRVNGHVVQQGSTKFSTVTAGTNTININPMSAARWIVDPLGFNGTHTTISDAVAEASNDDVILVFPGIYTENITIDKDLLIYSFSSEFRGGATTRIKGKITVSAPSLSVSFTGVSFETNGDNAIYLSGAGSVITFQDCNFTATNATAINLAGDPVTSNIYMENCYTSLSGGQKWFDSTGGVMWINNCLNLDSFAPLVANTASTNIVFISESSLDTPISISGGAEIHAKNSSFSTDGVLPCITTAGTNGSSFYHCTFDSEDNSCMSIGSGSVVTMANCVLISSNTNVLTGNGTVNTGGNVCTNSSGNNVSTINMLTVI